MKSKSVHNKYIGKMIATLCILCMLISLCGCSCAKKNEETDKIQQTTNEGASEDRITEATTTEDETKKDITAEATTTQNETREDVTTETTEDVKKPTYEDTTKESSVENETTQNENDTFTGTPYGEHGKLSVSGVNILDKNGNTFQLKGVSTHGISWFPQYVSYDTFKYLRDSWGANVVRIAMYTAEYNGYCSGGNRDDLKTLVKKDIDAATELGMYVVVDWHILSDSNPLTHKTEAINFFNEISSYYKANDNIIYEICNEPNGGTSWSDIKSYANEIIPVIRANDPDAIIVVGTPTWSQDVDTASWDKITGYDNIMYTLHYYAATHKQWLRDKAQTAINNGCALFVTEFSICDASGNGALDKTEADLWLDFLNKNGISFIGWNLANKNESSSLFLRSCNKVHGFADSDLSEWAKWLRGAIEE